MSKCSFCGKEISLGTGIMFVKNDGKIFHFCSKKCEKNMFKLKRKPNATNWSDLLMKRTLGKKQE